MLPCEEFIERGSKNIRLKPSPNKPPWVFVLGGGKIENKGENHGSLQAGSIPAKYTIRRKRRTYASNQWFQKSSSYGQQVRRRWGGDLSQVANPEASLLDEGSSGKVAT